MALLALTIAVLVGCGYEGPDVGEVVAHSYDDPDDWYTPPVHIPGSCSGSGTTRVCTSGYTIPGQYHHDDEHFFLTLDDGERRGNFEVGRATYESVRDGQWFDTKTGQVVPR